MTEGTVPVPPDLLCDYGIVIYYLFRDYRIFGGAESAGVKPP